MMTVGLTTMWTPMFPDVLLQHTNGKDRHLLMNTTATPFSALIHKVDPVKCRNTDGGEALQEGAQPLLLGKIVVPYPQMVSQIAEGSGINCAEILSLRMLQAITGHLHQRRPLLLRHHAPILTLLPLPPTLDIIAKMTITHLRMSLLFEPLTGFCTRTRICPASTTE